MMGSGIRGQIRKQGNSLASWNRHDIKCVVCVARSVARSVGRLLNSRAENAGRTKQCHLDARHDQNYSVLCSGSLIRALMNSMLWVAANSSAIGISLLFDKCFQHYNETLKLHTTGPPGGDQGISLHAAYEWSPPRGPTLQSPKRIGKLIYLEKSREYFIILYHISSTFMRFHIFGSHDV